MSGTWLSRWRPSSDAGGKVETKTIETARTAPRALPAGTSHLSGRGSSARDLKAAAAARLQTASRAPEPSRDEKHVAQAPTHEAKAARLSDASQANKHPKPSAEPQTRSEKERKAPEAPPMESHRPEAQAPAQHGQEPPRADANPPAAHAPKPKSQPGKKEKPEEKDKKPDGGNP